LSKCGSLSSNSTWIAFTLLFILILPIYSNTFHASWHLDDRPNIVNNLNLHINDLMPETLWKTFFAKPGPVEKFYRPLPCLTFALNWHYGRDDVTGYHAVNIVIHILTAFFLYLTILNLFRSPNLENKFKESEHFIALLSAALWAVNPIQTQAVTYIVQRMAIMAAMFYMLGINFYIKGRLADAKSKKILFYTGCLLSFLFALGSKENAILLPLSIILVEIIFFQKSGSLGEKKKIVWAALASTIFILFLFGGLLFLMKKDPLNYLNQLSEIRPFSFSERLLTEPIVVLNYLSQIFYPAPHRLSIEHDVLLSTSLFEPWTTLPAILIIFCIVGIGLSQIRKRPLIAFGILFFFLNHIVESTILPLELVFEHRNYLPSFFLFLPMSAGMKHLINFYAEKRRSMYALIIVFMILLLACLGWSTYIRNKAWANDKTLWIDAAAKAPGNARPLNVLAIELAWGENVTPHRYEKALVFFKKSLLLNKPRKFLEADIIGNIASIYFHRNEYQKAVKLYKQALEISPEFLKVRYDLIKPLILMEKWEEASKNADLLISNSKGYINDDYFNIKGFILLWQKKPKEALRYFRKALSLAPNKSNILINTGVALSLMGSHKNAEWFLHRAAQNSIGGDIMIYFSLIENSLRADDVASADKYTEKLFASFNLKTIKANLNILSRNYRFAPVSQKLIAPIIKNKLMEISDNFKLLE